MERKIVRSGAIPLDTDLLGAQLNSYIGLSKLAAALLGTSTFANGLACTPNSPADLTVKVAPGEIYSLQNIDDTAYSSIAADTTHQILKQGIVLDTTSLSCAAPGTAGFSINYLVQAAFSEVDDTSVLLPYYNASNPSQAWSGPNNSGTTDTTRRANKCVLTVKAGTAATTGSQTTPSPDSNNVGLWVVTVANGQTTITAGNIVQYSGAPFVPGSGAASNTHNAFYQKSVAGNADITLTSQEAAYPMLDMTGAVTGNANLIVPAVARQWIVRNSTTGSFTRTVKTAAGAGVVVTQGKSMVLYCDGVNVTVAGSANDVSFAKTSFTATAGQTSFTVNYTVGNVLVTRNGVMVPFTGTSGTAIVLTTAAAAGDTVDVYALNSFSVANALTAANIASAAQAQAQTDNATLITPAGLASALGGANQSLAASGYQKLPGGLIIQWGVSTIATATVVTFPVAFPTACRAVIANTEVAACIMSAVTKGPASFSASSFNTNTQTAQSTSYAWIALGH